MRIIETADALRQASRDARREGRRVGFVPTMGALHAGHLSLVQEARRRANLVVLSIFVNPTQFGPAEDFASYPRDLPRDAALAAEAGVDLLFHPASAQTLYAPGECTRVTVSRLTAHLCGPRRPGHFEGVATIVTKLLAICEPDVAIFGRKDYQQWRVIERLARDLMLPVEIVGAELKRDADGLALSSRNVALQPGEREAALSLPRALAAGAEAVAAGERSAELVLGRMHATVAAEPRARVEYLEVVDPQELQPLPRIEGGALLAGAILVGRTRLIDNREVVGPSMSSVPGHLSRGVQAKEA
jgi:pantoate--beta-alanine ligase